MEETKKKEHLNLLIFGQLAFAIIGAGLFSGGIIEPIAVLTGLSGGYYLFKKRKQLDKNQKILGWVLFGIYLILIGAKSQMNGIS